MAARRRSLATDPGNDQQRIAVVEDDVRRHADDLDDIAERLDELEEKIEDSAKASADRHEKLTEQLRGPGGFSERLLAIEASLKAHGEASKAQHDALKASLTALTEAVKPNPQHYTLTMDKTTAGTIVTLVITLASALGVGVYRGEAEAKGHPAPPAQAIPRPDPALPPSPYTEAAKETPP